MADLTLEQKQALLAYVDAHGRTWKSKLRLDWESACAHAVPRAWQPELQQIRNSFGPSWLATFKLDALTVAAWRSDIAAAAPPPGTPDPIAVRQMREIGGTWAAYENSELGHPEGGHLRFLRVGEGCTFAVPPERYPDTAHGPGWRYLHIGTVDLAAGVVVKKDHPNG